LLPPTLDEYVSQDNPVRAIDSYVQSLDLKKLGYENTGGGLTPGQPAFPPQALLKLYLYGYLHRVRSSRQLEAECVRNLEVIWLVQGLRPSYKTIADFRKDNLKALKKTNQDFVALCKELDLFGGELVGIDGSFFRGNVAKSSIYTTERLKRSLERVASDIDQYLKELEKTDQHEEGVAGKDPHLSEKLDKLRARQAKRTQQLKQLEESGDTQIAEVDPDARLLNKRGGSVAGYNVQTAVDAKHKLIVTAEAVQDGNDERQLAPMSQAAKAVLEVDHLEATADVGFFNAQQIKQCVEVGITPYVPEPDKTSQARHEGRFERDRFSYDPHTNTYTCPGGKVLPYATSIDKHGNLIWVYRSSVSDCAICPLKTQCLPAKTRRRAVTRWEHEEVIEAHRARMAAQGAEKMAQRAQLCEHPFGTLKMRCGWTHFLMRGLDKVRAELSLLVLGYNFTRVLHILGLADFRAYCQIRRLNPVRMTT
jgi:transposase